MSVRDSKFDLTEAERKLACPPLDAPAFRAALTSIRLSTLEHVIRAYVRDRVPAAFNDQPMLWEAARTFLASRVSSLTGADVLPFEVGMTGSGNLGFSPVPKKFGQTHGPHSDLDLFIVNKSVFEKLQLDVRRLCSCESEKYADQTNTLKRQVQNGFADSHNIPANEHYPCASVLRNEASIVVQKLGIEGMPVWRSHVRVYAGWRELANQLRRNFTRLRQKYQELNVP